MFSAVSVQQGALDYLTLFRVIWGCPKEKYSLSGIMFKIRYIYYMK